MDRQDTQINNQHHVNYANILFQKIGQKEQDKQAVSILGHKMISKSVKFNML